MRLNTPSENGFTLIELCIVMLISGMFMTAAVQAYNVYRIQKRMEVTQEAITTSQNALFEFRSKLQRYPCPADPALGPGDANYGVAQCPPFLPGSQIRTVIGRDSDNDGTGDNVYIGAVPVRTLSDVATETEDFSFQASIDGYGNKLLYAVSAELTRDSGILNEFRGAIDIEDEHRLSLVKPEGSAHMVILSHGENARGAYSLQGQLVRGCTSGVPTGTPPPGAMPNTDVQNCDNDAVFLSGLVRNDDYSYNDDISSYASTKASSPWKYTGSVAQLNSDGTTYSYINQITNANTGGNVGFGLDDPETDLHFSSNLRAQRVLANQICDTGGANCMPVENLAGDVPNMTCPAGEAVVSISNNAVQCARVSYSGGARACPAGQYMYAISNVGDIYCRAR